jgi:hypothetical protein
LWAAGKINGINRNGLFSRHRHLIRTIAEYVEHYHRERNHQGIENALIAGAPATDLVERIRRRPRLGGVLNYYERAA